MGATIRTVELSLPGERVTASAVYKRTVGAVFTRDEYRVSVTWQREGKDDIALVDNKSLRLGALRHGEDDAATEVLRFIAGGYLDNREPHELTEGQHLWIDLGRSEYLALELDDEEDCA